VPHFDRHTVANQKAMLVKLFGTLFTGWTCKLIGITTNGEKTNMGHVNGSTWLKTAYTLSTYLRKQSNLITEMGETCSKKTNRWLTLKSMLKFYITRAPRIVTFLDERREQVGNVAPPILTSSWWLLTYVFAPVITIIIETVVKL